jgi:hypothetical protein
MSWMKINRPRLTYWSSQKSGNRHVRSKIIQINNFRDQIYVSTLDEPDLFPPKNHVFHGDKISWFDVADKLPRFLGMPGEGKEPDSFGPSK